MFKVIKRSAITGDTKLELYIYPSAIYTQYSSNLLK